MRIIGTVIAISAAFVAAAAEHEGPTDPQIASIVVTANQIDIDAGQLALKKARSKAVRAFAQRMITDHTGVNKSAVDLVTKLHVVPETNLTSHSLQSGGEENIANLKTLHGAGFDRAYVDHEVIYHQHVLDAINEVLIPSASNAALKALLIQVEPAFVAHLEHAKRIQATLTNQD